MEADYFIRELTKEIRRNNSFISPTFERYMNLIIDHYCEEVSSGQIFYRARVYEEDDRFDKWQEKNSCEVTFYGYDEKGSFVNLESSSVGRCNVEGEHVLYMATDIITAIQEVCNKPGIAVSVSEIELLEDARIVDFAKDVVITSGNVNSKYDIEFLSGFMFGLVGAFNKSALYDDDYVLTQYVCKYIKEKKIDGLQFISSYNMLGGEVLFDHLQKNEGINTVLFNYEKAKARNSQLFLITNSAISIEPFRQ